MGFYMNTSRGLLYLGSGAIMIMFIGAGIEWELI